MKTLLKLICIIVLTLTVNSCGVNFRYNTLKTAGYVDTLRSEGYVVEEINSVSQLRWKLRTDWNFANDYYAFLQQQNYSFFHNQFFYNRLYRFGWNSPHNYWMNWQWNWHNGFNGYGGLWNSWNQYPYYGNWNTNYWWTYQNSYPYYNHIYGPRTQWLGNVYGRRGMSNNNRISQASIIQSTIDSNRNTTRPRTNPRPSINSNKPTIRTKPVIIRTRPNNNVRPPVNNTRPPVINNSRPRNNSRPTINRPSTPTRSTTPVRTSKKRGGQ